MSDVECTVPEQYEVKPVDCPFWHDSVCDLDGLPCDVDYENSFRKDS